MKSTIEELIAFVIIIDSGSIVKAAHKPLPVSVVPYSAWKPSLMSH